jgi:hypothetical protein
MDTRSLSLYVSAEIGKVSAALMAPAKPTCIVTLAHGAGAGMDHQFMVDLATSLAERDVATLRFNFPYMENKKKRPDFPPVAHKTVEAAINKAHEVFPLLPVFASGKSFGGRMSSQYLAAQPAADVKGVIFFGFPLHPSGKPSTDRAEHLKNLKLPMLFLQGTKDELATYDLIKEVCDSLRQATLVSFEGANHAFKAGKKDMIPLLADAAKAWIDKKVKK